jgi:isopentenyl phosphate kinase/predicted aconitase with swiveling domain
MTGRGRRWTVTGRPIAGGRASGEILISHAPISFFGGVDPHKGIVVEKGHPLEGIPLEGKILAFPEGKGSTVGSYVLTSLYRSDRGPRALVVERCEAIVAAGAIIAEMPCIGDIDLAALKGARWAVVDGAEGLLHCSEHREEIVLFKLGGSAITRKRQGDAAIRDDVVRRIAREIVEALEKKEARKESLRLVLIHGAGPFGHDLVLKHGLKGGIGGEPAEREEKRGGFLRTHASVAELNRRVASILEDEGLPVFPLQPSAIAVQDGNELHRFDTSALEELLFGKADMIPLLYGDMVPDITLGASVISGDRLATYLARRLGAQKILLGCDVDGVLRKRSDPEEEQGKKQSAEVGKSPPAEAPHVIREITEANFDGVLEEISPAGERDVTGGMRGKLLEIRKGSGGIPALIFNLLTPGETRKAFLGEETSGTRVLL